ncbi:Ubiquitin domain-containing protein [Lachnellula hyalina]|uniref:Ubiquitin domain-containing protein n=1 Tax=Lachnellula hyalina TaxID=1316788 RepID=A0A8H8U2Q0_9HELO|nr:Ubiquitin domain-containing protein [Lachnellula hyalina]TVY28331.1 Ubiquitin domain-containing protein [Lachnellula hyalina]
MASEDATAETQDKQVSFKVKTSSDGNHTITMSEAATVLDLKTKLSGDDYEKVPADRQRLIYSGRVMKNEDVLSKYNIKSGNTIHMVKSAQSNVAQNPAASPSAATGAAARSAPGVPTNMAAGTANNPLAGLTGARYAGHMALPGADMFGADGGMGAPPSEDAMAQMLEDPNVQQTMNEALNNPALIDMMIQQTPALRNNPHAREMFQSPEFRRMLTNPEALRQAAAMRRLMGGGAGGAGGFPAPGVTDTTPGAAGTPNQPNNAAANPFASLMGGAGGAGAGGAAGGANPFAALFGTPGQTPGQTGATPGTVGSPPANADAPVNPFASLLGGGAGLQGLPPITPEQMQQAMQALQAGGGFAGGAGGAGGGFGDLFGPGGFGGAGGPASPPAPADTRPPEERYADQLRQLNDMGFFDFDRNVEALRRSGGSVQGAIEQLLS